MFCPCTGREVFLCTEHIQQHITSKGATHQILNLKVISEYKAPGYFDRLRVRQQSLPEVRDSARENIVNLERNLDKYREQTEKMMWTMMQSTKQALRTLEEIRSELTREIEAAVQEVERTIDEDNPVLITRYGPLFRQLTNKPKPITLFTLTVPDFPEFSGMQLLSQKASTVSSEYLATAYGDKMSLHNITTSHCDRRSLTIDFHEGGSYHGEGNWLLCIGGSPATSRVAALDLISTQFTELWPMLKARKSPGVVQAGSSIYIFGGQDEANAPMTDCERWGLLQHHRGPVGNMQHPRAFFTPCLLRTSIYLVSADTTRVIEVFNLDTQVFYPLQVSLPDSFLLGRNSVAFLDDGELVVLTTGQQLARLRLGDSQATVRPVNRSCWSSQQPVFNGRDVLIACEGRLEVFSREVYGFK